jgi:hypothetical protein
LNSPSTGLAFPPGTYCPADAPKRGPGPNILWPVWLDTRRKADICLLALYLPDCPVALRADLCKLRAQITFDSDDTAVLKLRGSEAKILTLTVAQVEEW